MRTRTARGLAVSLVVAVSLLASPVVAGAAPTAPSVSKPDLTDDMRAVPDVDMMTDAAADADRRSSVKHIATEAHQVYVSVVNAVSGSAGDIPLDQLSQANVAAAIQTLSDYWYAETNGAVTFALAGYETRSLGASTCDPDAISTTQAQRAFGGSFDDYKWVGSNRHLLTLTQETTACGSQGFGSVGGHGGEIFDANGVSGQYGIPVLLHEFGHNLGFGHADVSICTTGRQDGLLTDFAYSDTPCPTVAYGDFLDIMGFTVSGATPHLSAMEKIQFGVFEGSYIAASGPGTVVLNSLNSTGIRALRIVDPLSGIPYVVEYRTPEGLDVASNEFTLPVKCADAAGVYRLCLYGGNPATGSVRILRELPFTGPNDVGFAGERTYTETTVLAVSPAPGQTTWLTPRIDIGSTFTSMNSGFTVHVDAASPATGATITLGYPVHAAVTATVATTHKAKQTYGAKSASRVVVRASLVAEGGVPVTGGTATLYDGTKAVASASVSNGAAAFRLAATTSAGKHTYSVGYNANDLYSAARSASIRVTVSKAHAVTTVRFSKATVSRTANAKARVVVKVAGVAAPTGKLVAYLNGKKLKTYTLGASKKGRLTITLPKISSVGVKSIYVKYRGSSSIAADNTVKKHLRITY